MEKNKERITAAMAGEYLGGIRAVTVMLDNIDSTGSWSVLAKKLVSLAEHVAIGLVRTVEERDALERRVDA